MLGGVLEGPSWAAWRVLLIAANGEALTNQERITFRTLTGREHEPGVPVDELWVCAGRRAGKSRAISVLASYVSALCAHLALAPGERGTVAVLAGTREQAANVFGYIGAIFAKTPFSGLKVSETNESISLSNGVDISVKTANPRTVRGISALLVVCDEIAAWSASDETSDDAILSALRPALATTNGLLVAISSPRDMRGALWETHQRHHGPTGDFRKDDAAARHDRRPRDVYRPSAHGHAAGAVDL